MNIPRFCTKFVFRVFLLTILVVSLLLLAFIKFWPREPDSKITFTPPSREERVSALGSLSGCSSSELKAYSFLPFTPVGVPGESDWLASHLAKKQTYDSFVRSDMILPSPDCKKLYLLPLHIETNKDLPGLSVIASYCEAFFSFETELLSPIILPGKSISRRPQGKSLQYNASQILERIKTRRPMDSFAMVAVTLDDIFPERNQSFAFGLAAPVDHVAIVSLARLTPVSDGITNDNSRLRPYKVTSHEISHLLGLRHCEYFQCLLNGSSGLSELDRSPLNLCPICLRKVTRLSGTDPFSRYERLLTFSKENNLGSETENLLSVYSQTK